MFALAVIATLRAQSLPAAQAARQWRQQHERAIVEEFMTLLAIPNVSRDSANIQRNAEAIRAALIKRGVDARLVSLPGANPIVFGEIRTPGATRTIGFYAHYDGQPLDPREWATPPFAPTLRNRRIDAGGTVIPLPAAGARSTPNRASMRAAPPTTRRQSSRSSPRWMRSVLPDWRTGRTSSSCSRERKKPDRRI
jgi:hypothetical protein